MCVYLILILNITKNCNSTSTSINQHLLIYTLFGNRYTNLNNIIALYFLAIIMSLRKGEPNAGEKNLIVNICRIIIIRFTLDMLY